MAVTSAPSELYNKKTLFSLGGASLAVWLFTTVIGNVFGIHVSDYKWIGLVVALFLSFAGARNFWKLNVQLSIVAFFNGLLIYVTACGIDAINHSSTPLKKQTAEASILPFSQSKIWWAPVELTDSIAGLEKQVSVQTGEIQNKNQRIKSIIDSCSVLSEHTDKVNEVDYKSLYYEQLEENKKLRAAKRSDQVSAQVPTNTDTPKDTLKDDKINAHISSANIAMLKKSSVLCNDLLNKLDDFNNSGVYNRGTNTISYLQKDIIVFQSFLKGYLKDVKALIGVSTK